MGVGGGGGGGGGGGSEVYRGFTTSSEIYFTTKDCSGEARKLIGSIQTYHPQFSGLGTSMALSRAAIFTKKM